MSRSSLRPWVRPLTLGVTLCALALAPALLPAPATALAHSPAPRDVDIGIPPGSALFWTRSFPSYTPPRGGLFATTPVKNPGKAAQRSSSKPATLELDFRNSDGFGLVRILTTDLPAHFRWMQPKNKGPQSKASGLLPDPPAFGTGLYWVSLAPLLRWMLHPQIVPYEPAMAHLLEIGEPVAYLLDDVKSENGLRRPVGDLRALLQPQGQGAYQPLEAKTVRDRMLSRFCLEELLRVHAYDPERSFAKRLLLFKADTEGWVLRYAREGNATVRRAAVAALGRYRSQRAVDMLLERALFSKDAVETVRALAGLSNFRGRIDVTPLIHRLQAEENPILQSALCGALGRPGAYEVIGPLLEIAEHGIEKRKTGVAIEALGALSRIGRDKDSAAEVVDFLEKAQRVLTNSSVSFAVPNGPMVGDEADGKSARAQVLLQLVRGLWLQYHSGDPAAIQALVKLADKPRQSVRGYGGRVFGHVHAPARLHYMDALARAGEEGIERLRAIAEATELDPSTRGHALRRLPHRVRTELAQSFLLEHNTDSLRLLGYETLVADGHADATALGHRLIAEAAAARPDRTETRDYLYLRAVRTLSERGKLSMLELAPLIFHAERPEDAFGDIVDTIRERIDAIIRGSLGGKPVQRLKPDIERLVDFVIRSEVNSAVRAETRGEVVDYIRKEIAGLKSHRRDQPYINDVRRSIQTVLLGWRPPTSPADLLGPGSGFVFSANGDFATPADLGEEVLLALGRTRDDSAAALLADFLGTRRNKNRAAACLGLGMAGFKEHVKLLASFLLDSDPFVRFCAYESLRHLTDVDIEIDWMYGAANERFDAAERYLMWALENVKPR